MAGAGEEMSTVHSEVKKEENDTETVSEESAAAEEADEVHNTMTSSDESTSSSASFQLVCAYRHVAAYVGMEPEDVKIVVERTLDFAAADTKTSGSFKLANRLKFKKRGDKLEVRALPTLKRIMKCKASTAQ